MLDQRQKLDQRRKSQSLDDHELEELEELIEEATEWEVFEHEDRDPLNESPRRTGA